ncbi:MAG: LysM peptidoglycan-binding domain-containing protein, partial [Acidimicrobiales bacterium]
MPGPAASAVAMDGSPRVRAVPAAPADTDPRWTVAPGDTVWSIAEASLGDGARTAEVLALNPGVGSPRRLQPGTELRLPVGAAVPVDRLPAAVAGQGASLHTVAPGDTLWALADRQVGAPQTPAAVATYLQEVVAANPALADPDLIRPGDRIVLPAPEAGVAPVEPDATDGGPSIPADVTDHAPAAAEPPVAPETTAPSSTAAADPASPRSDAESPPPPGDRVVPGSGGATGADPAPDGDAESRHWSADVPVPLGVAAGLLAAGLGIGVARRRRFRLAHRAPGRVPAPVPDALVDVDRSVRRIGIDPVAPWLWAALASLSSRALWEGEAVAQPVTARLDNDSLTLDLSTPDPMGAPLPWETDDDGQTWRLDRAVPEHELLTFHGRPVTPTMVTLGAGMMLNLEAVGALAVRGSGDTPMAVIRSLVHELASSPVGTVDIRTTMAVEGTDRYRLVRRQRPDDLAAELVPWLDQARDLLDRGRHASAYGQRIAEPADPLVPVVVITDGDGFDRLGAVVRRAMVRRLPVAVVVVGSCDDPAPEPIPTVLTIRGDRGRLEPYGDTFCVQRLSAPAALRLGHLLDDAEAGPDGPDGFP